MNVRLKKKTTDVKLQKLQRQTCLGITCVMNIAPTAAMEVVLDIVSLALQVMRSVQVQHLGCAKEKINKICQLKILQE